MHPFTHLTDRPAAPGVWPSTMGELEAEPARWCAPEKSAGMPATAAAAAAAEGTEGELPRSIMCCAPGWGGAGEAPGSGDQENWLGLKNLVSCVWGGKRAREERMSRRRSVGHGFRRRTNAGRDALVVVDRRAVEGGRRGVEAQAQHVAQRRRAMRLGLPRQRRQAAWPNGGPSSSGRDGSSRGGGRGDRGRARLAEGGVGQLPERLGCVEMGCGQGTSRDVKRVGGEAEVDGVPASSSSPLILLVVSILLLALLVFFRTYRRPPPRVRPWRALQRSSTGSTRDPCLVGLGAGGRRGQNQSRARHPSNQCVWLQNRKRSQGKAALLLLRRYHVVVRRPRAWSLASRH